MSSVERSRLQRFTLAAFAAEFLTPRVAIEGLAVSGRTPTLEEVVVAAHYGTNAIMTLFRFGQYGLKEVAP